MLIRRRIIRALSIEHLDSCSYNEIPCEFDLVISSGGFFGFYMVGVDKMIKRLEKQEIISIRRYSGSSVGAIASVLMCCGISTLSVVEMYERLYNQKNFFIHLRRELLQLLPPDAYERCSDRVFIHTTRLTPFGISSKVYSMFQNNEDLIDACMASSNFPFFISPFIFYRYRGGFYLDGWFTRSIPTFSDSKHQLIINLNNIQYSWRSYFLPSDESIEGLIVKGAIEVEKFLSREHPIRAIRWHTSSITSRAYYISLVLLSCSCLPLIVCLKRQMR